MKSTTRTLASRSSPIYVCGSLGAECPRSLGQERLSRSSDPSRHDAAGRYVRRYHGPFYCRAAPRRAGSARVGGQSSWSQFQHRLPGRKHRAGRRLYSALRSLVGDPQSASLQDPALQAIGLHADHPFAGRALRARRARQLALSLRRRNCSMPPRRIRTSSHTRPTASALPIMWPCFKCFSPPAQE